MSDATITPVVPPRSALRSVPPPRSASLAPEVLERGSSLYGLPLGPGYTRTPSLSSGSDEDVFDDATTHLPAGTVYRSPVEDKENDRGFFGRNKLAVERDPLKVRDGREAKTSPSGVYTREFRVHDLTTALLARHRGLELIHCLSTYFPWRVWTPPVPLSFTRLHTAELPTLPHALAVGKCRSLALCIHQLQVDYRGIGQPSNTHQPDPTRVRHQSHGRSPPDVRPDRLLLPHLLQLFGQGQLLLIHEHEQSSIHRSRHAHFGPFPSGPGWSWSRIDREGRCHARFIPFAADWHGRDARSSSIDLRRRRRRVARPGRQARSRGAKSQEETSTRSRRGLFVRGRQRRCGRHTSLGPRSLTFANGRILRLCSIPTSLLSYSICCLGLFVSRILRQHSRLLSAYNLSSHRIVVHHARVSRMSAPGVKGRRRRRGPRGSDDSVWLPSRRFPIYLEMARIATKS